jgi:hypothetical protein
MRPALRFGAAVNAQFIQALPIVTHVSGAPSKSVPALWVKSVVATFRVRGFSTEDSSHKWQVRAIVEIVEIVELTGGRSPTERRPYRWFAVA